MRDGGSNECWLGAHPCWLSGEAAGQWWPGVNVSTLLSLGFSLLPLLLGTPHVGTVLEFGGPSPFRLPFPHPQRELLEGQALGLGGIGECPGSLLLLPLLQPS